MRKQWVVAAIAVLAQIGAAAPDTTPAPIEALKSAELAALPLTVGAEPYTEPLEDGYQLIKLDQALSGSDRTALPTADTPPEAGADMSCKDRLDRFGPTLKPGRGFCWDRSLQGVAGKDHVNELGWVPQGLATTGEAGGSEPQVPTAKNALISSWTWQNPETSYLNNSMRLSMVNLDDLRYRNVLPVWVDPGGNLHRVYGHGGGLAWSGPYLFVATTPGWPSDTPSGAPDPGKNAIRVFDTRKIYFNDSKKPSDDYRYVMPEVAHFVGNGPDFDYISLDRTPSGDRALVVGDYRPSWKDGAQPLYGTRVLRYAFRSAAGGDYRLRLTPTNGWRSTKPAIETNAISDVQGVQTHGKRLYFSMGAGKFDDSPYLRRFAAVDPSTASMNAQTIWGCRSEDVSLWYDQQDPYGEDKGDLWGMTEGEQQRVVYSVKVSTLNSAGAPDKPPSCAPPTPVR